MKLLLINSVCGTGSTGRIVSDIWRMQKDMGNDVKVAFGIGQPYYVAKEDVYKISNKLDYYIHNALSRITDRAGFYSKICTRRLINYIKDYNPDVIHLHNLHGYYINIQILFKYLNSTDIKLVWTIHDCWPITGHCVHFDYFGCTKWEKQCYACKYKTSYPKSYFMNQSKRNFLQKKYLFTQKKIHITVPSNWLKNVIQRSYLGKSDIDVIQNGLNLNYFRPIKTDYRHRYKLLDKKIVLAVSNVWNQKKGIFDLIELSKSLSSKFQLIIIGVNNKQRHLFPKNVLLFERTNNIEELVKWYSEADVFVNPSYEETMGMTTYEALACGTPAIVYDRTALPEAINLKNGKIVDAGNIKKLKNAVYEVCERNYVDVRDSVKHIDEKIITKKWLNLYREDN